MGCPPYVLHWTSFVWQYLQYCSRDNFSGHAQLGTHLEVVETLKTDTTPRAAYERNPALQCRHGRLGLPQTGALLARVGSGGRHLCSCPVFAIRTKLGLG